MRAWQKYLTGFALLLLAGYVALCALAGAGHDSISRGPRYLPLLVAP